MKAATNQEPAHQAAGPVKRTAQKASQKVKKGAAGRAASAYRSQVETEEARTLIHRLGDHFSGIAYAGIVMILAAVMIVKGAEVTNVTAVDTIETNLLDSFSTGSSLIVLLILAIIFGYALSYMEFASMGGGGGGSSSRT